MIYQQEFVVEPNICNGFEDLAVKMFRRTNHRFYIVNVKPDPSDERNTRYTLESQSEDDFDLFTDDLTRLYKSGWYPMALTYLATPYVKTDSNGQLNLKDIELRMV